MGRPSSQALTAAAVLGLFVLAAPAVLERSLGALSSLWSNVLVAARAPTPQLPRFASSGMLELAALGGGLLVSLALAAVLALWLQRGVFLRASGGAGDAGLEIARGVRAERVPRAAIALAAFFAVLAVLLWPWIGALRGMLDVWQRAPEELLSVAGSLARSLWERAAIVLALVGAVELAAQSAWFRRRLRMSRRELQDEARATEGDPHARAERRRRAHETRMQATLLELTEVNLVVFDSERAIGVRVTQAGPVVWLRAEAELALRLRHGAEVRSVPLVHDPEVVAALSAFEPNEPLPSHHAERVRAQLARVAGRERRA